MEEVVALLHVASLEHLLNVLGDRRVGANLMLVHSGDELRFAQVRWRRRRALTHPERRLELLARVVAWDGPRIPALVAPHVQKVALRDHQTRGREGLAGEVKRCGRLVADCVSRTAREEAAGDELVDLGLVVKS